MAAISSSLVVGLNTALTDATCATRMVITNHTGSIPPDAPRRPNDGMRPSTASARALATATAPLANKERIADRRSPTREEFDVGLPGSSRRPASSGGLQVT